MTSAAYVHLLFGSLLWGLVISRFCWWLRHSAPSQTAEVREFSRQVSRMVYLILYLVIGVKQIAVEPATDCQVILAYGLIALVLVRLSAYLVCLRLMDGGRDSV